MVRKKKAFTIVELLVVVVLVGVIAVMAIPRLNIASISKKKADIEAKKITTDLRRTRRLAITNAATNTAGFALNMVGPSPYLSFEIVNLASSAIVDTLSIDSNVSCTGGNSFRFGPLGNLLAGSSTQLTTSAKGKSFTVNVISATGAVKCTEN